MGAVHRNLLHTLRQIQTQPGHSTALILTLGLETGPTAIFSFVIALLLRPLPVRDSDQLVKIESMRGDQPGKVSIREILEIQESWTDDKAHGGAGRREPRQLLPFR